MPPYQYNSSNGFSFRDPAGFFWIQKERAFRWVSPQYINETTEFLKHPQTQQWMHERKIIPTKILSNNEQNEVLASFPELPHSITLEHYKIYFPSYPYEWSPAMLFEAALLTLDLAEQSLDLGFSIKDATPYNILFEGPNPCFVDFLSFEKRNPLDGTWKAYGQFVRTFLLPLLAHKHLGISIKEIFLTFRDGFQISDFYNRLGRLQRLTPSFFTLVTLPEWLGKKNKSSTSKSYQERLFSTPAQSRFVLKTLFKHLRRYLNKAKPKQIRSHWLQYSECDHCTESYQRIKEEFLNVFIQENFPQKVLDIGCNTGNFSTLFANNKAAVVSIDVDEAVIDALWQKKRKENQNILSLMLNLTWPSPALGWDNHETKSFLERAKYHFDTVLMYAVIHHLMVGGQIPLQRIVQLASQLTQKWLIIEYVDPKDPMFQSLSRGRNDLYQYLNEQTFEKYFKTSFEIIKKQEISFIPRTLYVMKKK